MQQVRDATEGQIEPPLPPIATNKTPSSWQEFSNALKEEADRATPIARAQLEIQSTVNQIELT